MRKDTSALGRKQGFAAGLRLAPFIAVVGCAVNPAWQPVEIRPVADSVEIIREADSAALNFTRVVKNSGSKAIHYQRCGTYLQRQAGTSWQTVWSPICIGQSTPSIVVPGASVLVDVHVLVFTRPGLEPQLNPSMTPGTYRAVLLLGFAADAFGITDNVPMDRRASDPFVVR